MLKTTDGKSVQLMIIELDQMGLDTDNLRKVKMRFTIDGASSGWEGHNGEFIDVTISELHVRLSGGGHTIKIPNYDHTTLGFMIENAAELLLFEYDMDVE